MTQQLMPDHTEYAEEIASLKQAICELETINQSLKSKLEARTSYPDSIGWMEIKDQCIVLNILSSYCDPIKKIILNDLATHPMSIQELIGLHCLPQASTYRRVTELMNDHLISKFGFFIQGDSKRVYKYIASIKNLQIRFEENKIFLFVLPTQRNSDFQRFCENIC